MTHKLVVISLCAGCAAEEEPAWMSLSERRAVVDDLAGAWTCEGTDPRFEVTATGGFFGDKRHVLVFPTRVPDHDENGDEKPEFEKHELCDVEWKHDPPTDTIGATLATGTPKGHKCCVEDTAATLPGEHTEGRGLTTARCERGAVDVAAWALVAEDGRDGSLLCVVTDPIVGTWITSDDDSPYVSPDGTTEVRGCELAAR